MKAVTEAAEAEPEQPISWIGVAYNEITHDDPLGIFLMGGIVALLINILPAIPIVLPVLVPLVLSNLLTVGLIPSIIRDIMQFYQEMLFWFFCFIISIGRWADNALYLKIYTD